MEISEKTKDLKSKDTKYYQEFNNIQNAFYTSKSDFQEFTNYEIKKHGYSLLNNLTKGFPSLADLIYNLSGESWKGSESVAILQALQCKLINQYASGNRQFIPNFIYFKNLKPDKEKKERSARKKDKIEKLEFDNETRKDIMNILMIDSKSYEYLKFTDKIQSLGKQIVVQFTQTKKQIKTTK
jgi:hypothetical protein